MDRVTGPRFMATAKSYPKGIEVCTCRASPLSESSQSCSPRPWTWLPLPSAPPHFPLRSGVLFTQNCKCLVVTMTYCLGQCSFPMHTNILWLLYMNIFNDMEKVVDFLSFFFFFFWLEL